MKIESLIQRKNGTTIKLDDAVYHFQPERPGAKHGCVVENEAHIEKLLAITEGFCVFGKKRAQIKVKQTQQPLTDSEVLDAIDPEVMTNQQLIKWATSHGINYKSKGNIEEYYAKHYPLAVVDTRKSNPDMVRELVKLDRKDPKVITIKKKANPMFAAPRFGEPMDTLKTMPPSMPKTPATPQEIAK